MWLKLNVITVTYNQSVQFSSVTQSRVQLFATPWTAACQASLSITISRCLTKLMSIELVMLSNHLILCHPLLLLPLMFPSIRVFSNESALRISIWSYLQNLISDCPSLSILTLLFFFHYYSGQAIKGIYNLWIGPRQSTSIKMLLNLNFVGAQSRPTPCMPE